MGRLPLLLSHGEQAHYSMGVSTPNQLSRGGQAATPFRKGRIICTASSERGHRPVKAPTAKPALPRNKKGCLFLDSPNQYNILYKIKLLC